MTYRQLLNEGMLKARKMKKEEEAVRFLFLELSHLTATEMYLMMNQEIELEFRDRFMKSVDQYVIDDIPVQHIIGKTYFFGYEIKVNQDVLIPRQETEQLVEHVLLYYDTFFDGQACQVLDLGTGSGCIGIALQKELPYAQVTLADISEKALDVARENAQLNEANVSIIQSDWFSKITKKFSVIVSNPPYIPSEEEVETLVKKEPSLALFGGLEGLDFYDHILKHAKDYLEEDGLIAFEHGYQHQKPILELVNTYLPQAHVVQVKDLAGKDRFTFIGLGRVTL